MMRDWLGDTDRLEIIPIVAADIPYSMSIKLGGRTYRMAWRYNEQGDLYTVDLEIASTREVLCYGEAIRYGKPLFEQFVDERYPDPVIVPLCPTGIVDIITQDNFGGDVLLYLFPRGEVAP